MRAETLGRDDRAEGLPVVSVIVPFFDSAGFLAACIESLLGQVDVGGPFEVFCVDNGSTDGSAEIAARYPEVTLLRETTPGAYAARNAGLRHARAPLIAFTDADCVADLDWLRSIRQGLEDPSVDILLGHCRYPAEASWALRLLGAYENAKTDYVTRHCRPSQRFAYTNNLATRAEVFAELGPFKEWRRAADSELAHRLAASERSGRLVYQPSMRVTHLEFVSARQRARRLALYTETNSQIEGFQELGPLQRLGLLAHWLRGGGR